MPENDRKPSLRFKGFNDAWEQYKLKQVTVYKNGKGHEHLQSDIGDYELINLNSISIDGGLKPSGRFVSYSDDTLSKDDLVMVLSDVAHGDLLGRVALIPENNKYVLNQRVALLRSNGVLNPNYLYYIINNNQNYFKLQGAGSSQLNISKDSVENFSFLAPNSHEQSDLTLFFDKIDNLITLHQRKYDKLVSVKKALLDKMFPGNGNDVPKVRFKGFTDAWEQRKYSEIFNYERPDMFIVSSEEYSNTFNTPVLTANKGFILGYTNETRTYNNPCIIFDDFTLDTKYVDFPFMVKSSAIKLLTSTEGFDLRFSYELLSTSKIENLGHARHYISVVQPTTVRTPKLSEQQEISRLFQKIDSLITLHQRKHEKLQNIKKALLSKMFA